MQLRPGPSLNGLIREFGPEGQRKLVTLSAGRESVYELGPHTLADVLYEFVHRDRFCGHDTDLAYHPCPECAQQVKFYLDGLSRRCVL